MATSPALSPPAEMRRVAGLAACRVPSGGHSNRTPGGVGDGAGGGGGGGGEGGDGDESEKKDGAYTFDVSLLLSIRTALDT